jgi:hypothetical protein
VALPLCVAPPEYLTAVSVAGLAAAAPPAASPEKPSSSKKKGKPKEDDDELEALLASLDEPKPGGWPGCRRWGVQRMHAWMHALGARAWVSRIAGAC